MRWIDVIDTAVMRAEKLAGIADALRGPAVSALTSTHVGYYADEAGRVAIYNAKNADDIALAKAACDVAGLCPRDLFLSYQELSHPECPWVKVAYSHALRRAGELLQFFPGQMPGGIPNYPSPLSSALTSGLLGAGLGWAGGKLLGGVLPQGYGDNLGRTGALLGGAIGVAPSALWAATNHATGRPLNDPALLNHAPGEEPDNYPNFSNGSNAMPSIDGGSHSAIGDYLYNLRIPDRYKRSCDEHEAYQLRHTYTESIDNLVKAASAFGSFQQPQPSTPIDVNVDALGRVLWDGGADPALATTMLGVVDAASRMPDPAARSGWVTGHQLGQFAANAAGNYAEGLLVGAALNAAVGTPWSAPAIGAASAALGVIGAVVPRLFG